MALGVGDIGVVPALDAALAVSPPKAAAVASFREHAVIAITLAGPPRPACQPLTRLPWSARQVQFGEAPVLWAGPAGQDGYASGAMRLARPRRIQKAIANLVRLA